MIEFHRDHTRPAKGQVFVFGSNEAGIHGAGAAALALEYGAEWGKGVGHYGMTYAIPTKDRNVETLNLSKIRPYIVDFVAYTKAHPELQFFVTRVGCGLAGYEDYQIAPLFKGALHCSFPETWEQYVK
jgi:hypothetical protein|nr:MAG TPA: hypothetical protein [Caudoviricetes sp.]